MCVSLQLERLWPILMRVSRETRSKFKGPAPSSATASTTGTLEAAAREEGVDVMTPLWALRARMAYVVEGIIYYMQVGDLQLLTPPNRLTHSRTITGGFLWMVALRPCLDDRPLPMC